MPRIYRRIENGNRTNFYHCELCLDEQTSLASNQRASSDWIPWTEWNEDIIPRMEDNHDEWEEAPFNQCDRCFAVDEESRKEYLLWEETMVDMEWEEREACS